MVALVMLRLPLASAVPLVALLHPPTPNLLEAQASLSRLVELLNHLEVQVNQLHQSRPLALASQYHLLPLVALYPPLPLNLLLSPPTLVASSLQVLQVLLQAPLLLLPLP